MKQQQITLETLWPKVRPCGAYILEDVHTSLSPLGSQWQGCVWPSSHVIVGMWWEADAILWALRLP